MHSPGLSKTLLAYQHLHQARAVKGWPSRREGRDGPGMSNYK